MPRLHNFQITIIVNDFDSFILIFDSTRSCNLKILHVHYSIAYLLRNILYIMYILNITEKLYLFYLAIIFEICSTSVYYISIYQLLLNHQFRIMEICNGNLPTEKFNMKI